MKPLKINELQSIICIAEEGKISSAAERLHSSQANLSRLLSNVESQIGLKIFNRSTRNLSLSEFGEVLLPRIHHALQASDDICNFIDSYKSKPAGHVTIAAPLGALFFLARHVIPIIAALHEDISISLVSYTLKLDSQDLIMSPEWDLMFSISMPKDENLIARQVSTFTVGLFATKEFLIAHPIKKPHDLTLNYSCILLKSLGENYNTWQYIDRENNGEIKSLVVNGKYNCEQTHYAVELARQGLGIVYSPYLLVMNELNSGELVPCLKNEFSIDLKSYLVYRNRKYQPHRVNVIIDTIIEQINKMNSVGGM